MASVGMWMRDKDTNETVKIDAIGAMIAYSNNDVSGEIQAAKLEEHFVVLDDPTDTVDIEALLRAKIEADEAETGLYDLGISYVVVDRVDDEITFQWFSHMIPFVDVINGD